MPTLIAYLRAFNSKERFFLVAEVLGNRNFTPAEEFRQKLGEELGLLIPSDVFSAMDFHIDWLYASLQLAADGDTAMVYKNDHRGRRIIKGQQEDIDWLIAYRDNSHYHIILIEAKGVTGWTNEQMTSKAKRFRDIFGNEGKDWAGIEPHFVLMSPEKPPKGLVLDECSKWMKPKEEIHWLPLEVPKGLKGIVRCNNNGKKDRNGDSWKVESRK